MTLIFFYILTFVAAGLLGLGLWLFYLESRRTLGDQEPATGHEMKILGLIDFSSNRLSLLFIAAGVALIAIAVPGIVKFNDETTGLFETRDMTERRLRKTLATLVPPRQRETWIMSFSSCVVVQSEHARLTHFLAGLGFDYVLHHNHSRNARTPNLASQNTVYFYHSRSKPAADALAQMMAIETGAGFSTTQGDSNGIPPQNRAHALAVHWITETCSPTA